MTNNLRLINISLLKSSLLTKLKVTELKLANLDSSVIYSQRIQAVQLKSLFRCFLHKDVVGDHLGIISRG